METVTVSALTAQKDAPVRSQWIDVRSATEFAAGHLPGAINIPMDEIEARLHDLGPERPIVLVCKSGGRARMVADLLEPCRKDVSVLAGGTDAWRKAGLPIVASRRTRWSLERQVRLAAGGLVLAGTLLAVTMSRDWLVLTGFVGLGLMFAGLSDYCPMAVLLGVMPWNRTKHCPLGATIKQEKGCL